MQPKVNGIGHLEKPVGTLQILVHLYNNKKATITSLIRNEQLNQRTTYSALSKLQKSGLIFQEESMGFPVCKYYFLTEKGPITSPEPSQYPKFMPLLYCKTFSPGSTISYIFLFFGQS